MDENITNPFEEGLSLFGVDLSSNGTSWAGNVCQKWENICRKNIVIQDPSLLTDALGEHLRKICEEVANDFLDPFSDDCIKGPVSDLSLEQDIIANICKKSKVSRNEGPPNVGPLISVPSEREAPVIAQDGRKEACGMLDTEVRLTAEETKENGLELKENPAEASTSSSADGALNTVGRRSMLSDSSDLTEENESSLKEVISPAEFSGDEHECGLRAEESPSQGEIAGANMEDEEEFEVLKLDDGWEHAERCDLPQTAGRDVKNRSYKKKLREVLRSNLYSLRKKSSAPEDRSTAPSVRTMGLSISVNPGLDWELLDIGSKLDQHK